MATKAWSLPELGDCGQLWEMMCCLEWLSKKVRTASLGCECLEMPLVLLSKEADGSGCFKCERTHFIMLGYIANGTPFLQNVRML